MAKDLAIVLNNGSINSAVTTAMAAQKHRPILLHGEVTEHPGSRVRGAYDSQVAHFRPYREHTIAMPFLSAVQSTVPQITAGSDPRAKTPLSTQLLELVPLIGVAVRFAAHYQAAAVYLGVRVGQNTDELAQAMEFAQIWNEMIQLPCALGDIEVRMPLLELEAWQVVDVGFQVAAPFEKTWSCSTDGPDACWACRGCRSREAAFQQAARPDPLRVARKL